LLVYKGWIVWDSLLLIALPLHLSFFLVTLHVALAFCFFVALAFCFFVALVLLFHSSTHTHNSKHTCIDKKKHRIKRAKRPQKLQIKMQNKKKKREKKTKRSQRPQINK